MGFCALWMVYAYVSGYGDTLDQIMPVSRT